MLLYIMNVDEATMIKIETPNLTIDIQKLMAKIGEAIKQQIIENIKKGVDNNGQALIPYSKGYAATNGAKVDFKVTGRMLSQLKVIIKDNKIIVGIIGDRAQIAYELGKREDKNWDFTSWGTTLALAYDRVMKEELEKVFK